jgi:uncharacterized membrane protein
MTRSNGHTPIELEISIGRVLWLGVLASSVCLSVGLVLAFAAGDGRLTRGLLTTGIVILLATPVARVVVSNIEYAREGDWPFFALTLILLAELATSVAAALYRWTF